jgi:hypothetical protein
MRFDVWLVLAGLCLALWPAQAFAYLDPGSGSLFLHLLLAGVFGALFFLKTFYRRIRDFVLGRRS